MPMDELIWPQTVFVDQRTCEKPDKYKTKRQYIFFILPCNLSAPIYDVITVKRLDM